MFILYSYRLKDASTEPRRGEKGGAGGITATRAAMPRHQQSDCLQIRREQPLS